MAGCDYLPNIKGFGLHKGKQIIDMNDDFILMLEKMGVAPEDYREKFVEATMIFQHQTVFDPTTKKSVPLCEWKCEEDQEKHQLKCGKYPLKQMMIESTVCRIT